MTTHYHLARRRVLGRLGLAVLGLAVLPIARKANAALGPGIDSPKDGQGPLGITDLTRPRTAKLPKGGVYDHETQQMTDYEINVAGTSTGGGEDNCCQSTTFWDGERS